MRLLCTFFATFFPIAAFAACGGSDLLAAMAAEDRAALHAKAEAEPYPNGILWQATRGEEIVHLVGTMHFHDPRHQATLDQVRPWIDAAETIFLELGDGDEARLQADITADPSLAFILDGPTLPELLGPADWDRLRAAMADRGMPGFMAAKMKPWMALMTLSLTQCVMQDVAFGKKGLDGLILDYATEIGNPARALEPNTLVISLFEQYEQGEMLDFLSLFLRLENYSPDDQHHTLVESYFREEIRIIWEFSIAQSLAQPQGWSEERILTEYERLEDVLIGQRNRAWMDHILPAAAEGPVFLAAGALHMPGEMGLLALLEREGFTITPIARN